MRKLTVLEHKKITKIIFFFTKKKKKPDILTNHPHWKIRKKMSWSVDQNKTYFQQLPKCKL